MSPSPFLSSLADHMAVRHYSKRTVASYLYWIKGFILFHGKQHPTKLGQSEVVEFLTYLAVKRTVSPSTQTLALNALAYLYNKFLNQPLGDVSDFRRSFRQPKLPAVMTREEVRRLLSHLQGTPLLIVSMLYGSGLRRIEMVRLRVKQRICCNPVRIFAPCNSNSGMPMLKRQRSIPISSNRGRWV